MFSACLRSNYYCSPRTATKKLWFLASSLPTNTAQELFSLRRILSNTFTAHSHSTLPDPSQSSSSSSKRRTRKKDVSPEKPDSVLSLLRNHGFTITLVSILVPNIALLRKLTMPETSVVYLLTNYPKAVTQRPEVFNETVSRVAKMGFNPSKSVFVKAVIAFSGERNKAIWDRCYKTYTKWGWSNDEILLAFKKQPRCMLLSEKKIAGIMEFLVNTMGWHSSEIAACPDVFTRGLEKTIVPRCSLIHLLLSKSLLKKKRKLGTVLKKGEKSFIKMFVTKYEAQVPELMSFYQEKKVDALKSENSSNTKPNDAYSTSTGKPTRWQIS